MNRPDLDNGTASLAIVIPAWKPHFLDRTLRALLDQTDRDFRIYVGDDHSPHGLEAVVSPFLDSGRVVYHRFEENLGQRDLVAHWERCVALSRNEPWIWLFSDDDLCSPDCVERVLGAIRTNPGAELFHFAVQVIDESDAPLTPVQAIPLTSSSDYLERRIAGDHLSFVVEYVFSREVHRREGGFQSFDLAWGSDDATWVKFGRKHPPVLVPQALVRWRASSRNISPAVTPELAKRKVEARLEFLRWLHGLPTGAVDLPRLKPLLSPWFHSHVRAYGAVVHPGQVARWCARFSRVVGTPFAHRAGWTVRLVLSSIKARLLSKPQELQI